MPIPTRSQSIKAPSGQTKPQYGKAGRDEEVTRGSATPHAVAASTGGLNTSRLPAPEKRSLPKPATGHGRSQSSSTLTVARPHEVAQDGRMVSRPDISKIVAHARSRSVLTSAPLVARQSSYRLPAPQTLSRDGPKPPEALSRIKPPARTQQQLQLPRKAGIGAKPTLERSIASGPAATPGSVGQSAVARSRIDDELFQLAAVHDGSTTILQEFERSIHDKIAKSALAIRSEERLVRASERERQIDLNTLALHQWLGGRADGGQR
jgi:hypothetical protein